MNKRLKLTHLLLIPLLAVSCGKKQSGDLTFDIDEPSKGNQVSEASLVLNDGSQVTIKNNMSQDETDPIFEKLKPLNINETNLDISLNISINDEPYQTKASIRYTSQEDKHGYYRQIESNNCVMKDASTSVEAMAYSTFGYIVENGEMKAFFGRIPSQSTIDFVNSGAGGKTILYEDPENEEGVYTKGDVPATYPAGEFSEGYFGCQLFSKMVNSFQFYDIPSLYKPLMDEEGFKLSTSFEITDKYLILNVEKPYGLLGSVPLGTDKQVLIEGSKSANCYLNVTFYYDLISGEVAFCKSSFVTLNYAPEYRLIHFEGSITIKAHEASLEGYERYTSLKKEVIEQSTSHK